MSPCYFILPTSTLTALFEFCGNRLGYLHRLRFRSSKELQWLCHAQYVSLIELIVVQA